MKVRRLPRSLTELIISSIFIAFELLPIKVVILSISLSSQWHIFAILLPSKIKMQSSFKCICSHPWNNYFWIWRFWRSKMILTCIQGVLLLAVIINICINRPRNAASSRLMTPRLIQLIIQDHLFSRERSLFWAEANNWTWARIRKSPSCKPMSTHLCQVHIIILFIQIHTSSTTNKFGSKFKITKRGINTHLVRLS